MGRLLPSIARELSRQGGGKCEIGFKIDFFRGGEAARQKAWSAGEKKNSTWKEAKAGRGRGGQQQQEEGGGEAGHHNKELLAQTR